MKQTFTCAIVVYSILWTSSSAVAASPSTQPAATPPRPTLLSPRVVEAVVEIGTPYVDRGATAWDNFDGNITDRIVTNGTVNTRLPGTYDVTYDVTDRAGNAAHAVRRVHVVNSGLDRDNDGLSDWDEIRNLGASNPFDLFDPDTTGDNFSNQPDGVPDGLNDYDGDGMTNALEFMFGFNPLDPQSFGLLPWGSPAGTAVLALSILFLVRRSSRRPRRQRQ